MYKTRIFSLWKRNQKSKNQWCLFDLSKNFLGCFFIQWMCCHCCTNGAWKRKWQQERHRDKMTEWHVAGFVLGYGWVCGWFFVGLWIGICWVVGLGSPRLLCGGVVERDSWWWCGWESARVTEIRERNDR